MDDNVIKSLAPIRKHLFEIVNAASAGHLNFHL